MQKSGGEPDSSVGKTSGAPEGLTRFGTVIWRLRKRRIIETLVAFIGGGWLLVEVVERLLVGHYKFPDESIDLAVVSAIGALLATLVWRWFRGTEKRPGNVKVEVLLVPLIILATAAMDMRLGLQIAGLPGKALLIGIVALCLGLTWVILKLSQWASAMPESREKEIEVSELSAVRPEKSIVVLPFTDLSPQKDQEYFCDGMTEEIIADLSQVRELLVISRSSAMTFKGSPKTVRDIAKDLNIRYVMEGSVRKAGNDLRITAQLIDAMNDAHIWAEKYSGTLDDVFDIQEKVSLSIVKALKLMLTSEEAGKMAERPIGNIAAYECYLKAKHDVWSFTKEGTERAVQYLQNALDILRENATLYAGLGLAYFQLVNLGIKQDEHLDKARDYVQKAFALDPGSAQAHAVRGYIYSLEGDMRLAISHMKKAASADPSSADTLVWLSWFYTLMGKNSAAAHFGEKGLQIDPVNPTWRSVSGVQSFFEGRFDLAAERLREGYKMAPKSPMVRFWYTLALAYAKRFQESLSILDIDAEPPSSNEILTKLSELLRASLRGDGDKISDLLTPDVQETCKRDPQCAYHLASFYSFLNQSEPALNWLENAINRGICPYPLMEVDPFLANIRSEPRFKKLMERVKYEWEHFEG
jgi:TolB-like protein/Flp pilus assembly protein TadD